jgi:hypothetical protein
MKSKLTTGIGISLPVPIMAKIDAERGDISRSRYVLRLLEKAYHYEAKPGVEYTKQQKTLPQTDLRVGRSVGQSVAAVGSKIDTSHGWEDDLEHE